ncbi:unnamed protein product [Debaryomyces tyrocola]|nr:unnamed protein product [Debaryomyces tyrocola]
MTLKDFQKMLIALSSLLKQELRTFPESWDVALIARIQKTVSEHIIPVRRVIPKQRKIVPQLAR